MTTPDQLKHMVDRFLMWELPRDLNPDGGISFKPPEIRAGNPWWPVGTNFLSANQATAMVKYMVDGMPLDTPPPTTDFRAGDVVTFRGRIMPVTVEALRPADRCIEIVWFDVAGVLHRDAAPEECFALLERAT